jgi:hypothetical protein
MIDLASLSQSVSYRLFVVNVEFFFLCLNLAASFSTVFDILTGHDKFLPNHHLVRFLFVPSCISHVVCNRQVSVVISSSQGTFLCGGSIISPGYILTAGHCMKDLSSGSVQNPANIVITPGISRTASSAQRGVQRFWVHSTYDASTNPSRRIDLGEEF